MATRAVLQTFEKYQKERVAFVTAVAEMAKNPQVGESDPVAMSFHMFQLSSTFVTISEH